MKEDSLDNFNISQTTDKYIVMKDFIQCNLYAFQNLNLKNFSLARKAYKKCIELANKLEDGEIKLVESQLNYSISSYFCGRFIETKKVLEDAFNISNRLFQSPDILPSIPVFSLHIRVICNLIMILITFNNSHDAKYYINYLFDILQKNNENTQEKQTRLEEILYILFRITSLTKIKEDEANFINPDQSSKLEISTKNYNPAVYAFHKFLRENNSSDWFQLLAEEAENFKQLRDVNGLMFTLINQSAVNYIKTNNISETASENFEFFVSKIKEKIVGQQEKPQINSKEKNNERILVEMKLRFEIVTDFYKKLYEYEELLLSQLKSKEDETYLSNNDISHSNTENNLLNLNNRKSSTKLRENTELIREFNKGNKALIKIFLKNCSNLIDSQVIDSQTKNHIELTFKLLETQDDSLIGTNILMIDSDIIKALKHLYINLVLIRNKCTLLHSFRKFKYNTHGYSTREEHLQQKYNKNNLIFEGNLLFISEGESLHKLNFKSNGITEHYYMINPENRTLRVYKNQATRLKNEDAYKEFSFNGQIVRVNFGLLSNNIVTKYRYLSKKNKNKPWLFISFDLGERTIDLYLDESTHIKWYTGLRYFINEYSLMCEIASPCQYFFNKVKLRILYRVTNFYDKHKNDLSVQKNHSFIVIEKLQSYIKDNIGGYDELPFFKILCFFWKVRKEHPYFSENNE